MKSSSSATFGLFILTFTASSGQVAAQNAAVTTEKVEAHISGKWTGSMIDGNGKYFTANATVTGDNGTITELADLPMSPADKAPKLTGTYFGPVVEIKSKSGFNWHLVMSKDEAGKYHLDGTYVTTNRGSGKAVLIKE